uniref:Uncharacterized protein n=1 Tax=Oryza glumipatula TaxID=40148 RepID=A0A0E0AZF7_9ORYZ
MTELGLHRRRRDPTGSTEGADIIGGRPGSWLALAQSVAARGSWPKSVSSDSQEVIEAGVEHPSKSSHRRRSSASLSSVKPRGGGFGSDDNGDKEVQGRRGGELDGGKKQGHGSGAARHSALRCPLLRRKEGPNRGWSAGRRKGRGVTSSTMGRRVWLCPCSCRQEGC